MKDPLLDFLKQTKNEVDIFCFQEVLNCEGREQPDTKYADEKCYDLYTLFEDILDGHQGYFRPHFKDMYGLAIFVRKGIKVIEEGERFVHKEKGYIPEGDVGFHARNIQYVTVDTPQGARTIINFHGLWNGKGKTDTKDRLVQSEKILYFMKELKTPLVLCGDFNLLPTSKYLRTATVSQLKYSPSVPNSETIFFARVVFPAWRGPKIKMALFLKRSSWIFGSIERLNIIMSSL